MAKSLMQGKIGYYVNGKLVHMPKRNVKVENVNEVEIKRKGSSKAKKGSLRNARQDWIMSRLEDLKNESKRGRMKQAFSLLAEIDAYENFKTLPVLKELTKTGVKHLFEADMEERSAIYYAAYSGNFNLVEFYLSLFLVYYVKLDPVNVGTYQSFRDWFEQIGTTQLKLRKTFTEKDYDTCFLNALNEKTRFILSRKNMSIDQAIQCIEKNLNSQESVRLLKPKISDLQEKIFRMGPACLKEKRNKRKPSLIIDDCDYSEIVEEASDSSDEQSVPGDDKSVCSVSIHSASTDEGDSHDLPVEEEFIDHDQSEDRLVPEENNQKLSCECPSLSTCETESDQDEWDVVSDVESVMSYDSEMARLSYKAALVYMKKPKPSSIFIPFCNISRVEDCKESQINQTETTNEYDNASYEIDADMIRDGYKNGRGGKKDRMFKGNRRMSNQSSKSDESRKNSRKQEKKRRKRRGLKKFSKHLVQ